MVFRMSVEEITRTRHERRQHELGKSHGFGAEASGRWITEEYLPLLVPIIENRLQSCGHQLGIELKDIVQEIGAEKLAALGLDVLPDAILKRHDETQQRDSRGIRITLDLGEAVQELAWEVRADEKLRKKLAMSGHPRSMAKRADYRREDWHDDDRLRVGNWLLDCCLELNDVFQLVNSIPCLVSTAVDNALAADEAAMWSSPAYQPLTAPPPPCTGWRLDDGCAPISPTFLRDHDPASRGAIEAAFADGSIKPHVGGVNTLRNVAFRINEPVLAALERVAVPLIKAAKEKKKKDVQIGGKIVNITVLQNDLATAKQLAGAPFFIDLNCDFRGRITPLPHFHYQRSDYVRGLFLFDVGAPIGDDGIIKLMIHFANSWGRDRLDKKLYFGRYAWAQDRINRGWLDVAIESEWVKAKEPYQFLAAALELRAALEVGSEYVTHLPIGFDGSCSAVQHICLLMRAVEGALVNLKIRTDPTDFYQLVADEVKKYLEASSDDKAIYCLGLGIDRDLIKPSAMTYGYSVTKWGMARQLEEKLLERDRRPKDAYLNHLAGLIIDAVEKLIPSAKEVRKFVSDLAKILASDNLPLEFISPTGVPVVGRYLKPKYKTINLLLRGRRVRRKLGKYTRTLSPKDAANSSVPNLVHALDASHLIMTVNACREAGIKNMMTVHDCFFVLAPQASAFKKIALEQLKRLYKDHDPLTVLRERAEVALATNKVYRSADQSVKKLRKTETPKLLPPVPPSGSYELDDLDGAIYALS
jgi:Autographiviridae RNA polymerase